MADEPEAERLELQEEEEEGGPVKSFLEHLEDLRWVLIKSLAAAGVAMLACFFGGNYVFKVLKWPLERSPIGKSGRAQVLRFMLGTNVLQVYHVLGTNDVWSALAGTNRFVRLEIVPFPGSTNQSPDSQTMLGLKVQPEPAGVVQPDSPIDIVSLGPAAAFVVA